MKVFVDCRWFSQPGQGVVTYLSALHMHAEQILDDVGRQDLEFWYGVDNINSIDSSLLPIGARVIEVGRRSLLWRLLVFPLWLRGHGFDIAHFQYVAPLYSLGVKYVATIHDILFRSHPTHFSFSHRFPRNLLYGWTSRNAACVLTVSERSAEDIMKFMPSRSPPVVVYNGAGMVKPTTGILSTPVTSLQGARFLLTVGRIEPRKNYGRLCEAFCRSALARSGMHLVVVGFCDREFAAELSALQDTEGVLWLARVSEPELNWLYSQASGFVYPSLCEGFGIPVLEAIDVRLPIAVSSTFPLADVLAEADHIFDPTNVEDMAQAISRLAAGVESSCNRERLLIRYSWQSSAALYLDTLRQLSHGKSESVRDV